MKKLLQFLFLCLFSQLSISQSLPESSFWRNVEVYYSPFQTRIGGFEHELLKENKSDVFGVNTSANTLWVNDFEFGANYVFKIKTLKFGVGLSYYTNSYKFMFITDLHSKLYRLRENGLSLNLFYRQPIVKGTTVDFGLNVRTPIFDYSSNRNTYNDYGQVSSTVNVLVNETWRYGGYINLVPSVQFNTLLFKGFYMKYGVYAKYWGREFYSVVATEKYTSDDVILDFRMRQTCFKATISFGYSFNN